MPGIAPGIFVSQKTYLWEQGLPAMNDDAPF
jgi:hypothetical protein